MSQTIEFIAHVDIRWGPFFTVKRPGDKEFKAATWGDMRNNKKLLSSSMKKIYGDYLCETKGLPKNEWLELAKLVHFEQSEEIEVARIYLTIMDALKDYHVWTLYDEAKKCRNRTLEQMIHDNMRSHYQEVIDVFKSLGIQYIPKIDETPHIERKYYIQEGFDVLMEQEGECKTSNERIALLYGMFILSKCLRGMETHINDPGCKDDEPFYLMEFRYLTNGLWATNERRPLKHETKSYYQLFHNVYSIARTYKEKKNLLPTMAPLFSEVYEIIMEVDRENMKRDSLKRNTDTYDAEQSNKKQKV